MDESNELSRHRENKKGMKDHGSVHDQLHQLVYSVLNLTGLYSVCVFVFVFVCVCVTLP